MFGETAAIGTGLFFEVPPGWEMQIRSRSGNSLKGIVVANAPGTIDSGYRGELKVILHNQDHNHASYHIKKGDKIAQFNFQRVEEAELVPAYTLSEGSRGADGFGSTGR